ncbi:hypothetical protein I3843_14G047100 [Carya illinoinensis]|nr:hypothetical protein I3843_14G047100 [Carya illinoinensis]KAG7946589.1 hypothetical protein I3843_14G047100 [Carya illinoinensis]
MPKSVCNSLVRTMEKNKCKSMKNPLSVRERVYIPGPGSLYEGDCGGVTPYSVWAIHCKTTSSHMQETWDQLTYADQLHSDSTQPLTPCSGHMQDSNQITRCNHIHAEHFTRTANSRNCTHTMHMQLTCITPSSRKHSDSTYSQCTCRPFGPCSGHHATNSHMQQGNSHMLKAAEHPLGQHITAAHTCNKPAARKLTRTDSTHSESRSNAAHASFRWKAAFGM